MRKITVLYLFALVATFASSCKKERKLPDYYTDMARSRHWSGYLTSNTAVGIYSDRVDTTLALYVAEGGQKVAIWGDTLTRQTDDDTTVMYKGIYSMFHYYKQNDSMAYAYFRTYGNIASEYKLLYTPNL